MPAHPSLKMKPDRRAALFAAATQEFTDHGFEGASLNRIITGLGISKSSFYHYFTNKSDLFEQILTQSLAPLTSRLETFDPDSLGAETFWPALQSLFGAELITDQPDIIATARMFYRNLDTANPACTALLDQIRGFTNILLERGQNVGVVRSDLPPSLLLGSAMGLGMAVDRWIIDNIDTLPISELATLYDQSFDLFIRILRP